MKKDTDIQRFIEAQQGDYEVALQEIRRGRKRSHWIWYIFPQMRGLGHSYMSHYYGIQSREEAEAYLRDELLGTRLRTICQALLTHKTNHTAEEILSPIDALKVRSSMTLFDAISPNDIFAEVLQTYYDNTRCPLTQKLLITPSTRPFKHPKRPRTY